MKKDTDKVHIPDFLKSKSVERKTEDNKIEGKDVDFSKGLNIEKTIQNTLTKIEEKENVRILLAVESGSRAWGFPSPDSDYDVRFIYARKKEDYLKLEKTDDVIEWCLDEVLDINGWDLKKALQLLHASNPTVLEWCSSPIVYREAPEAKELRRLCMEYFSPRKDFNHYLHMAMSNYRTYLQEDNVRIKKYLYVIRPLLAAYWIESKNSQPPMLFTDLVEAELKPDLVPEIEKLLRIKSSASETDVMPKIQALNDYIDEGLEYLASIKDDIPENNVNWEMLETFFLKVID